MTGVTSESRSKLSKILADAELPLVDGEEIREVMRKLIDVGAADLPRPGCGKTRDRWWALARVGRADLSLAKVFESHADALAILDELGEDADQNRLHAVWAAEGPGEPLVLDRTTGLLDGLKPWCSGAAFVERGLVTAIDLEGRSVLVIVDLNQTGVAVQPSNWVACGMAAAGTTALRFSGASARVLEGGGAYLERPGFWQGGAGIAAVWFGAALAVADRLSAGAAQRDDPHANAHLGAVETEISAARALLLATADWIDENPDGCAFVSALRLRLAVESAATSILERAARAMGPGPLSTDDEHSQRCSDLAIFIRQSHGERDLAALGEAVAGEEGCLW